MNRFKPFQPYRAPRGGMHRIKTFDPTYLVQKMPRPQPEADTEVVFEPKHAFADFGLQDALMDNIWARGYSEPTPIQDQVIPLLMVGRDVVGMANTGTGKTAAFALPFIQNVIKDNLQKLLVVAPTRELAVQIDQEIKQFIRGTSFKCVVCIGGVGLEGQIRGLSTKPNFVVGTPGRLKDLANQAKLNLGSFNNVVLDEVDRMLDMGFVHDVTNIMSRLPAKRQVAFFSATIPDGVVRIMKTFLVNPEMVKIVQKVNVSKIAQEIVKLNGKPKIDVLHDLLIQKGFDKVLVFGRSKHGLERLYKDLDKRGLRTAAIHGNKSQAARQKSLEMFKSNRVRVLLATDVASRGLDIDDITHVINYDLPESMEDYIHRIGRTGRMHKRGIALTLV